MYRQLRMRYDKEDKQPYKRLWKIRGTDMAKEELYHIALDDYEHGIVIRSLNDEKTDLMNEGKS